MLNKDDILHIAALARLNITEKEIELYQGQLGSILGYVEKLQEVDTEGVDELSRGVDQTNVFRADVVEACGENTRKQLVDAFPRKQGDLLEVQAVFEDRNE